MRDLLSASIAFAVTLVLLRGLRAVAVRMGLVDVPDARKSHSGAVPLVGGLAMFVGFAMAALTLDAPLAHLKPFFAGCALLVMVGVLDDLHELSSRARFAAQILAASIMIGWGGVVLADLGRIGPGGSLFALGAWSVPFTVFCTVGVINALNMADGADGLAGGLALVAFAGLAWVAHDAGLGAERDVLALLGIAVLAFLALNARLPGRARAQVFMGDAGSMFLGFAITWFFIRLSQGAERAMPPVTALWLLLVPLFDTVWLLFRRPLTGRPPTAASHDHLHHLLQRAGLGTGTAVSVLWGVAAAAALAGLAARARAVPDGDMFALFLGLFATYAVTMALAWWWRGLPPVAPTQDAGIDRRLRGERRRGGDRRR